MTETAKRGAINIIAWVAENAPKLTNAVMKIGGALAQ